jgi:Leucine-rich repeat (LRR) protein
MLHNSTVNVALWKKHLGHIPDRIWEHPEMETLVLAENDLNEIPARIANLEHLRMLDLGHNALTQLPEEVGDLRGLQDFLYLHDNRPASLPASLNRSFSLLIKGMPGAEAPPANSLAIQQIRNSRNRGCIRKDRR